MAFIKLDRAMFENKMWFAEPFTKAQAWIDLIGMANYADKTKYYNGKFHKIMRGQLVTSQRTLAERWKWSKTKVQTYIQTLVQADMLTADYTNKWTVLTVVNYAKYQDWQTAEKTTEKTAKQTAERPQTRPQQDLQEEIKKERNKKSSSARARVPTMDEVVTFVQEEDLTVDPKQFVNYYDAFGWEMNGEPIKNWKAVCRKWSKNEQASTGGVSDLVQAWVNGEISYD